MGKINFVSFSSSRSHKYKGLGILVTVTYSSHHTDLLVSITPVKIDQTIKKLIEIDNQILIISILGTCQGLGNILKKKN